MEYSTCEQPVDFSSCSCAMSRVTFQWILHATRVTSFYYSEQNIFSPFKAKRRWAQAVLEAETKKKPPELNSVNRLVYFLFFYSPPHCQRCENPTFHLSIGVSVWGLCGSMGILQLVKAREAGVSPTLALSLFLRQQYSFHLHTCPPSNVKYTLQIVLTRFFFFWSVFCWSASTTC